VEHLGSHSIALAEARTAVVDRLGTGLSPDEHCSCDIAVFVAVLVVLHAEQEEHMLETEYETEADMLEIAAVVAVGEGNGALKVEAFCGRQGRTQVVRMLLVPAAAETEAVVDDGSLVAPARSIPLRPFLVRYIDGCREEVSICLVTSWPRRY
jgi:hypothetical protein